MSDYDYASFIENTQISTIQLLDTFYKMLLFLALNGTV